MSPLVIDPTLKAVIIGQGVLKMGDEGGAVRYIQQSLTELGMALGKDSVDGKYDESLKLAVEEFQSAYGLSVTGKVDKRTVLALMVARLSGHPPTHP